MWVHSVTFSIVVLPGNNYLNAKAERALTTSTCRATLPKATPPRATRPKATPPRATPSSPCTCSSPARRLCTCPSSSRTRSWWSRTGGTTTEWGRRCAAAYPPRHSAAAAAACLTDDTQSTGQSNRPHAFVSSKLAEGLIVRPGRLCLGCCQGHE